MDIVSNDSCFLWSADENIGTITPGGYFTASNSIGASGNITVSAGNTTQDIKVFVVPDGSESEELLFSDIQAEISENRLTGTILNEYNIDVQKENLKIT